ncbi:MAG: GDP-mannose 4,6-dehydratase [Candidatus Omnitrophica bacterium]|nr:GDP-mannose 4,6-dehydratase [Candidatus Omnitrophota bacterium]
MILVTGGAGFIGSHLIDTLVQKGEEVVCLDSFDKFYDPEIKEKNLSGVCKKRNFILKRGDIRDEKFVKDIFNRFPIEKVVHLAARAGVRASLKDPILYADVNIGGTLNLLKFSQKAKIRSFILGSSSSVYGLNARVPFNENDKLENPISPYAVSKIASEFYGRLFQQVYGLPIIILRFFTVYGPRQRPEMAIHKFTELMERGEEIPVFGEGRIERDYTYISDIIKGILSTLQKDFNLETFNLGDSRVVKLTYLISILEAALGKKAKVKKLPEQPGDMPVTYADITSAREKLSYKPMVQIEEGIKRFVEWYRKGR